MLGIFEYMSNFYLARSADKIAIFREADKVCKFLSARAGVR
jgi:hypothetical protein